MAIPLLGLLHLQKMPRWVCRHPAIAALNSALCRNNLHRYNIGGRSTVKCRGFSTKTKNNAILKCLEQNMNVRSGLLASLLHSSKPVSYFTTHVALLSQEGSKKNTDKRGSGKGSNRKTEDGRKQNDDEEDDDDNSKHYRQMVEVNLYVATLFFIIYLMMSSEPAAKKTASWTSFINDMLCNGEVEYLEVMPDTDVVNIYLHKGAIINGIEYPRGAVYHMEVANILTFEEKVRKVEHDFGIDPADLVQIKYTHSSNSSAFISMLLTLGLAGILIYALRNSMGSSMGPLSSLTQLRKAKFTLVSETGKGVSFKDVAGLHEAKVEVMEFIDYLKNPSRFTDLGAKVPQGALLLGPPGCGKTLLAKALATESDVPFLYMAGSEFVEVIGGLGAARVRDLFLEARKRAPCIIYIDELDAIGRKRSQAGGAMGQSSGEEEQTLNQLLVEMDGMGTQKGVIMIASTNRADVLDLALLRPGRFDRHILIDMPTLAERKEIFVTHLTKLKLVHKSQAYASKLAQITAGLSGADIANICNEAALYAAREGMPAVDFEHFNYAVEKSIAGTVKKTKILSPEEKSIVAFHEAGHALVGWLLEHTDALLKVSIVPRTTAALGFAQHLPSDKYLVSKEELFQRMCMGLGGRVAEAIIFNRVTSGAENDLKKVTGMAYQQIRELGMNDQVGQVSFDNTTGLGRKPYSKRLANVIDQEAKLLIGRAYKKTEHLLQSNMGLLRTLADALLKGETLNYDEIRELIGPPPFGDKRTVDVLEWDSMQTPKADPQAAPSS